MRVLRSAGHSVIASDINSYDYALDFVCDFLTVKQAPTRIQAIVTNPPYRLAGQFVAQALRLCPLVAMLCRLAFYESLRRAPILDAGTLARVHVFRRRLPMMHRDGWSGPTCCVGDSLRMVCLGPKSRWPHHDRSHRLKRSRHMSTPTFKNHPDKPRLLSARIENMTVFVQEDVRCAACGPAPAPNTLICSRSELLAALARLRAAATVATHLAALQWGYDDAGQLDLFLARQPSDGSDRIDAATKGAAQVAVPVRQLVDMLKEFGCQRISIETADKQPIVLRGDDEKLGLIAPTAWSFPPTEVAAAVA
ncbi:hypothetical protein IVB18_31950 [Bradyrhizobium sp. 186]|uniref:hypothetical protein n=1 Tax=Bradyrhizobium sp. 186 TaxID=2782654 RepID=UPI00200188DE|nr:hypothetical protein [Bradyrhizobium sp. 186]UPK32841.1 hypothetical protein IVB18_31950 [Bradyrhizobium sp. 186]